VNTVERSFTRRSLWLFAGLLIWAANFFVTYVFTALACARGFAGNSVAGLGVIPLVTIVSSLVAILANAAVLRTALMRYRSNGGGDSLDFIAGAIATVSMAAIAWTGFTAAVGQSCR
jgi:hypothetical protein